MVWQARCGWEFSNSAVIVFGNLRVGSQVHPCTVEPKMRIHAHFTLGADAHYKKTRQPSLKSAKPSRSPSSSVPAEYGSRDVSG